MVVCITVREKIFTLLVFIDLCAFLHNYGSPTRIYASVRLPVEKAVKERASKIQI